MIRKLLTAFLLPKVLAFVGRRFGGASKARHRS